MTKPECIVTVKPDKGGRYRWWAHNTRNGNCTSVSGEDFASKGNALRAARREFRYWPAWSVEFVKG